MTHNIDDKLKKYDILTLPELGMLHDLEENTGFKLSYIRFTDASVLEAFRDVDNYYMKRFGELYRQVVQKVEPQSFSDPARIDGLIHGVGTWADNGEQLINNGIGIRDIISSRDDVMQYLMSKGISRSVSYRAMHHVRGGKGLTQEMTEQMKSAGIPDWYIESCNKIQYAYPWGQCVEYTIINWRLAYYWLHYPKIYRKTYEKQF